MSKYLLTLVVTVCLATSHSSAYVIESCATGSNLVDLSTGSPGTLFTLNYTEWLATPCQAVSLLIAFESQTPYAMLNIQLDSGPTVYSFVPTAPATSQTAHLFYDPAYLSGAGQIPSSVLPQAWKDDLADGTLQGRLWVDGAPWSPQWGSISGQLSYIDAVPEPATLSLFALGGLAVIRHKRKQARLW